jgi:hypothetical protein
MRYLLMAIVLLLAACRKSSGDEPGNEPTCRLRSEWTNISGSFYGDTSIYSYDGQGRLLKKYNSYYGSISNPVFTNTTYEYASGKTSIWPVSSLPEINTLKNHLYLSPDNRPLKYEYFGIGRSYLGLIYQFSDYNFSVALFHYNGANRLDSVTYYNSNQTYALLSRNYALIPQYNSSGNIVRVLNTAGFSGTDTTFFTYDNTPNYYHAISPSQHWLLGNYSLAGNDHPNERVIASQFSKNNITSISRGDLFSWLKDSVRYELNVQGLPKTLNSTLSTAFHFEYDCK